MTFTQSAGLRDREFNKFITVQTGSVSAMGVVLHAIQSGTSTAVPLLCNSEGMLLISGI